jgi:hypothetical protein
MEFEISMMSFTIVWSCRNPTFEGSVRLALTLPKMGLGSPSGLLKIQNSIAGVKTLRIEVFFLPLEKVLKCKCSKWPRMSQLDICSTSYGQKKGRELNWQFVSRPLKVENRPDPSVCRWSATHPWKSSQGNLQVCFRLHPNQRSEQEVMNAQSLGSLNRDNFETPLWESWEKVPFGCKCGGETQRILYGGRWWLPPNSGHGESKVAHGLSQHQKCAE